MVQVVHSLGQLLTNNAEWRCHTLRNHVVLRVVLALAGLLTPSKDWVPFGLRVVTLP